MIVFRADGNDKVGYGHVFRCLSIADALSTRGEKCTFLLAGEDMLPWVKDRGHEARILGTRYDDMESEIPCLASVLRELSPRMIVVDSYYVTEKYLNSLMELTKVAYVDDLASFPYPAMLLINYNVYGPSYDYRSIYEKAQKSLPELLLGPTYVPLRKQCQGLPARKVRERVKDVLISTGGTDPLHLAMALMRKISRDQESKNIHFHFLVGSGNPDKETLFQLAEELENVSIHYNLPEVTSLFMKCDLAISASGSTLYELCACGTPTVTYAMADNQLPGNLAFESMGLMISAGDLRTIENREEILWSAMEQLSSNLEKRMELSQKMQAIVDGKGADRLAKALLEL